MNKAWMVALIGAFTMPDFGNIDIRPIVAKA